MFHVLVTETEMLVARHMKLIYTNNRLHFQFFLKSLSASENTVEHLQKIYEDVPKMVLRLLDCSNTPTNFVQKSVNPVSERGMYN